MDDGCLSNILLLENHPPMIAMRILTMMTTMIQNQPTVLNTREKHPFFSFPSPLPRLSFLGKDYLFVGSFTFPCWTFCAVAGWVWTRDGVGSS